MRYLKRYNESQSIPSYFIDFDDIGRVFNPKTGYLYAKLKAGGYDSDNPEDIDSFEDEGTTLPNEYLDIIESHSLDAKDIPIIKKLYNKDIIDSAKELSLEYLDDGYKLRISVKCNFESLWNRGDIVIVNNDIIEESGRVPCFICNIFFNNLIYNETWSNYFENDVEVISKCSHLSYVVSLYKNTSTGDMVDEIVEILNNMYPDEDIISE